MQFPSGQWKKTDAAWRSEEKEDAPATYYPLGFIEGEMNREWVACVAGNEHAHALLLGKRKAEYKKIQQQAALFSAIAIFFLVFAQFRLSQFPFLIFYAIFMFGSTHFSRKISRSLEGWLLEELVMTGLRYRDIAQAFFANDSQIKKGDFFRARWLYPTVMTVALWGMIWVGLVLSGYPDREYHLFALVAAAPVFMCIRLIGQASFWWHWARSLQQFRIGLYGQLDPGAKFKVFLRGLKRGFVIMIVNFILGVLPIIGLVMLRTIYPNIFYYAGPTLGLILVLLERYLLRLNELIAQKSFKRGLETGQWMWDKALRLEETK